MELKNNFTDKDKLVAYVKKLAPWALGEPSQKFNGATVKEKLENIDPKNYGKTRNYGAGDVTKLSPYIHHGIISLNTVRNQALKLGFKAYEINKFIQELAWRDFWQRIARDKPHWLWENIENYKTGFTHDSYADELPDDILTAATNCACINSFINDLQTNGYVHNHARMYLASYVVHFRKIKWQLGAQWFLEHLLDGDEASNNLSWQWVASTFSSKPYIFNLDNVKKYFSKQVDTSTENNLPLAASYAEISAKLFPGKTYD